MSPIGLKSGPISDAAKATLLTDFVEEVGEQFEVNQLGHSKDADCEPLMVSMLDEGLASVSAWPAFGGFGRLLREGTHLAHHSALLV